MAYNLNKNNKYAYDWSAQMDWRCQGARQLLIVLLGVAAAQVTYDDNPFNLLLFFYYSILLF